MDTLYKTDVLRLGALLLQPDLQTLPLIYRHAWPCASPRPWPGTKAGWPSTC